MIEIILFLTFLLITISIVVLFDRIEELIKLEINHYEMRITQIKVINNKLALIDKKLDKMIKRK